MVRTFGWQRKVIPFSQKSILELEKVQSRALNLSRTPIEIVPLEQRRIEVYLREVYLREVYVSSLNGTNTEVVFYIDVVGTLS